MNAQTNFRNKTTLTWAQYRRKRQVVFSTPLCRLALVGGGLLIALTAITAYFHLPLLAILCLLLGLGACWIFPVKAYRHPFSLSKEYVAEFQEKGFQIGETLYKYSRMTRICAEEDWIVFEFSRDGVVMDANGFEGITVQELIAYLRQEHPEIPVKWRKKAPAFWYPALITVLGLALAVCGFCMGEDNALPVQDPLKTPISTTKPKETEISTTVPVQTQVDVSTLLLSDPLRTANFDYFSMDIPEGLPRRKAREVAIGEFAIEYFKYGENLLIMVHYQSKSVTDIKTLQEYATTSRNYHEYEYDLLQDIAVSEAGNYGFEMTGLPVSSFVVSSYIFFLEVDNYYVTVYMACPVDAYDMYRSHFKMWESTIVMHETPTGIYFEHSTGDSLREPD